MTELQIVASLPLPSGELARESFRPCLDAAFTNTERAVALAMLANRG
jgi:hypothetical protein